MIEEAIQQVYLRSDFYRDGFYKALTILIVLLAAVGLLVAASIYLFVSKPASVVFSTASEWRVISPVPLDQPYLTQADLIQWVTDVLPKAFTLDFVNYPQQLAAASQYYTPNGLKKITEQINTYASYDQIGKAKLFVTAAAGGAPVIQNQGLVQGVYGWWIQMPLNLSYSNGSTQSLIVQALIIRLPTLNNLSGVGIENIIVRANG